MSTQRPLPNPDTTIEWIESLLQLFWAVDKVLAGGDERVPEAIVNAHQLAEKARRSM